MQCCGFSAIQLFSCSYSKKYLISSLFRQFYPTIMFSWTFEKNLPILPVCFPTKKISITTNSRKLCFSFPFKYFYVKSVCGTMFDFFLSLVRVETETLAEFPGGDWMQFAESRQARPGC